MAKLPNRKEHKERKGKQKQAWGKQKKKQKKQGSPPDGLFGNQEVFRVFSVRHCVSLLSMELRMTSSFRMQAVITILKALP